MFLLIFTGLKLQVHMRSYAVVHTRVNNDGHVIAMTFGSVCFSSLKLCWHDDWSLVLPKH